jgi:polar amino acid transport system substrate-binding protein
MSFRTRHPLRALPVAALVATACAVTLTACSSAGGTTITPTTARAAAPAAATDTGKCKDGQLTTASIAPGGFGPGKLPSGPTMARIEKNKQLVVGTSGDVRLWGARDTITGQLDGFDIRVAQAIGKALNVPVAYKVINYGQRLPYLKSGAVDIVADQMTINCDRWQGAGTASAPNAINFSSVYYEAGQKMLVRYNPRTEKRQANDIADLEAQIKAAPNQAGNKVCVVAASTSEAYIAAHVAKDNLLVVDDLGDCLVKFQDGEAVAITGDDTVLAGFAAQDPYSQVVGDAKGEAVSSEPYGIGVQAGDTQFTQFVNGVLEQMRGNGKLKSIYASTMGTAGVSLASNAFPTPRYGRDTAQLGQK